MLPAPRMLRLKLMSEVSCYRMERMLKCTRMNREELKLGAVIPTYSQNFPWIGAMFSLCLLVFVHRQCYIIRAGSLIKGKHFDN